MWTQSLWRIALSTSLAVAGGLSLVGVLASLPGQFPVPAEPAPIRSGPGAGSDRAGQRHSTDMAVPQTAELDRAIERAEAILEDSRPAADAGPLSDAPISEPATPDRAAAGQLAGIAPAAGRPSSASPADQPLQGADQSAALDPSDKRAELAAEERAPDSDAGIDPGSAAESEREMVAGAYIASTIREGAQSAAPGSAPASMSQTDAGQPAATQAAAAKSAAAPTVSGQEAIGYVIIGSFRQQENAARHVAAHRAWEPQVLTRQVDGTLQHRVAVGPFRAADLSAVRQHIIANGIADAWHLPLGTAAGTPLQTLDILG